MESIIKVHKDIFLRILENLLANIQEINVYGFFFVSCIFVTK